MATDWIKIRKNLCNDSDVVRLTSSLNEGKPPADHIDRFSVVGRLCVFWAWLDDNTDNGKDVFIPDHFLDDLVVMPCFANALRVIGWLKGDGDIKQIPIFAAHNGKEAKRRAQNTKRNSNKRTAERDSVTVDSSRSERDTFAAALRRSLRDINTAPRSESDTPAKEETVSVAQPARQRRKKAEPKTKTLSATETEVGRIQDVVLKEAAARWIVYKEEKRQGYRPSGLKAMVSQILNQSIAKGVAAVVADIDGSMAANYAGIIWGKGDKQGSKTSKPAWQQTNAESAAEYVRQRNQELGITSSEQTQTNSIFLEGELTHDTECNF